MPNAPCPMLHTQCPMPNAQCPMPHAQCPMPNDKPLPIYYFLQTLWRSQPIYKRCCHT
ncbi:hypothetical protein [Nostoc sp.]|uniref:hypothetical protein n=1 Tax=Nostoc sp. TaxID=1180 RepID=UPI002FF4F063